MYVYRVRMHIDMTREAKRKLLAREAAAAKIQACMRKHRARNFEYKNKECQLVLKIMSRRINWRWHRLVHLKLIHQRSCQKRRSDLVATVFHGWRIFIRQVQKERRKNELNSQKELKAEIQRQAKVLLLRP